MIQEIKHPNKTQSNARRWRRSRKRKRERESTDGTGAFENEGDGVGVVYGFDGDHVVVAGAFEELRTHGLGSCHD